ncbi:hypothetical protein TeGR_g10900, partial [Tetraparma gracilis]
TGSETAYVPPEDKSVVDWATGASSEDRSRLLNVDHSPETSVWSVDILPLDCWSAGTGKHSVSPITKQAYPVRPFVVLISSLYPTGTLLTHSIPTSNSCDELHTGKELMGLLTSEMLESSKNS